jgi:hypothetical protein
LQALQTIRLISDPIAPIKGGTSEMMEAYTKILNNPWFLRVWTLQECIVAQKGVMVCGRSTMDWEVFAEASTAAGASLINQPVFASIFIRHKQFQNLKYHHATMEAGAPAPELLFDFMPPLSRSYELELLASICNLQATIAHDRIYSLYSIFHSTGIVMPSPDYQKSIHEVFQEATLAYIQCRKKLAILTITLPSDDASGFPSWVPDWFTPAYSTSVHCDTTGVRYLNSSGRGGNYLATLSSYPILTDINMPGKLGLKGKILGKIEQKISCPLIGNETTHKEDGYFQFTETCMQWCRMLSAMKTYSINGEDHVKAACGVILSHKLSYLKLKYDIFSCFELWFETMLYSGQQQLCGHKVSDLLFSVELADQKPIDIVYNIVERGLVADKTKFVEKVRYADRFIRLKANYAVFLLDTGFLGTAFHTCREGDELALLAGLNHPVILRRQHSNEFRIVAPAYCHGVMDGEVWSERKMEEIILI